MVKLASREQCTGCTACAASCPHEAISMMADDEGFLQPVVDEQRCVRCGKCERVCPALHRGDARRPLQCLIATAKSDAVREQSSSGGVFTVLAERIVRDGGKVYGAAWQKPEFVCRHIGVDDEQGLAALRGSKYVQSDLRGVFPGVKKDLDDGKPVLFSGCPCQIAGLKSFLGRKYDNLMCVSLICNSVPSPRIFKAWCEAERKRVGPVQELLDVKFRDKQAGWHNSTFKFRFTTTTTTSLQKSAYYWLWQEGYAVRRSCIDCVFREFRDGADLTIGDAWGIERFASAFDDNRGGSAILAMSEKGADYLCRVKNELNVEPVGLEQILLGNPTLIKSFDLLKKAGPRRDEFWRKLNAGGDVIALAKRFTRRPLRLRIRMAVGKVLRKAGLRK